MAIKPGTSQQIIIPDIDMHNQSELSLLQQQLGGIDLMLKNSWKPLSSKQTKTLLKDRQEVVQKIQELEVIPPQVIKQFELIATKCSQYIQGVQQAGGWLYRGYDPHSSSRKMDSFVAATWGSKSPRDPRDSDVALSRVYDQVLKKQGFKALRLLSIFTTGDKSHAKYYGESDQGIYIIMPVDGKSNMLWAAKRDIELYGIEDVFMKGNLNMYKDEVDLALISSKLSSAQKRKWQEAFNYFPVTFQFDDSAFDNCVNMVQEQFSKGNPLGLPAWMKKNETTCGFCKPTKIHGTLSTQNRQLG